MRCTPRAKNVGWRLDYFLVSSRLLDRVQDTLIRDKVRKGRKVLEHEQEQEQELDSRKEGGRSRVQDTLIMGKVRKGRKEELEGTSKSRCSAPTTAPSRCS